MSRSPTRRAALAPTVGLAAALVGCEWVDSTGAQPGDDPVDASGTVDGGLAAPDGAGIALDELAPGEAVGALEDAETRLRLSAATAVDADGAPLAFRFEETPLAEGALEACAALDGFDPARAAGTLAEACTDGGDCALSFAAAEPGVESGAGPAFTLSVPRLRAPLGRRHALVGTADPGPDAGPDAGPVERVRREIDFCLIAVNEAPDPRDDTYAVADGGALEVFAEDGVLANDEDDVDAANEGLFALVPAVVGPERAAFFELRADGGFTYEPLPLDGAAEASDRFEYAVSDGLERAESPTAVVTIAILAGNLPPVAVEGAPALILTAGEFALVDLSDRFVDPEGDSLAFGIEGLPGDGSLALSPSGILSGVPGRGDVGEHAPTLLADDGGGPVGTALSLVVEPGAPPPGPSFVSGTTFDQTLRLGQNIAAVVPEFEGGAPPLAFESGGEPLPRGVVVDPDTGRVAGRPREIGRFGGLAVTARDANGAEATSDAFSIRVR